MSLSTDKATAIQLIASAACLVGVSSVSAVNRSIDGTGNHPLDLGAANSQLIRQAPAAYPGDGSGSTIIESPARPNPRDISNAIFNQGPISLTNDRQLTDYVWQWGQFLDHDIDLTEAGASNGTANIPITDPTDPLGPSPISFDRSNFDPATGTSGLNPRQQINEITAFIDGSGVYGSDTGRATWLRTGTDGKLKTSANNLLPFNDGTQSNAGGPSTSLFVAGDVRANEQAGLASMHTLFVREHNRLADLIKAQDPTASDEEIYQTARKIVGAEIQAITYNEFLPALMGSSAPSAGDYAYSTSVDPSIANEFSTASYRFGHSMLSPNLKLVNNLGATEGFLALRDAFFSPDILAQDPGNLDLILKGLSTQLAQEIDLKVVDDVRNFLFGAPGSGGLDLAALNIQRGRDHGLPDYNTIRQAYGLPAVTSFAEISSDPAVQSLLASVYGSVDNIDAWVGGLAEDHLPGSSIGKLLTEVLGDQFTRLRDGDAFFYTNDSDLYTSDILSIIDVTDVTLSDVIRWNTDITNIQENVFIFDPTTVVPVPTAAWTGVVLLGAMGAGNTVRRRFS